MERSCGRWQESSLSIYFCSLRRRQRQVYIGFLCGTMAPGDSAAATIRLVDNGYTLFILFLSTTTTTFFSPWDNGSRRYNSTSASLLLSGKRRTVNRLVIRFLSSFFFPSLLQQNIHQRVCYRVAFSSFRPTFPVYTCWKFFYHNWRSVKVVQSVGKWDKQLGIHNPKPPLKKK